jgi:cytidylate kinase
MEYKCKSIAVSGKSGCGNTTVSKLTAETLGLVCVNFTFRNLAQEHNISLKEVMALAVTDQWWDREVDRRQVALARESQGCVLGSRLAIWMLPEAALKVYLEASLETRVRRIINREEGAYDETAAFTAERDRQDHERYLELYSIDNNDYAFADLVIDTSLYTPQEIAAQIAQRFRQI